MPSLQPLGAAASGGAITSSWPRDASKNAQHVICEARCLSHRTSSSSSLSMSRIAVSRTAALARTSYSFFASSYRRCAIGCCVDRILSRTDERISSVCLWTASLCEPKCQPFRSAADEDVAGARTCPRRATPRSPGGAPAPFLRSPGPARCCSRTQGEYTYREGASGFQTTLAWSSSMATSLLPVGA